MASSVTYPYIYLASQSPRRQELLQQLGVRFELLLPRPDEDAEALEATLPGENAATDIAGMRRHGVDECRAAGEVLRIGLRSRNPDGCHAGEHDDAVGLTALDHLRRRPVRGDEVGRDRELVHAQSSSSAGSSMIEATSARKRDATSPSTTR